MDGDMVPLAFFAFLAAIIIVPKYLRYRNREQLLATLRAAYERGAPVPPELVETLQGDRDSTRADQTSRFGSPDRDLRRAVVLIAVALALVTLGFALEFSPDGYEGATPTIGVAAFPGFIGLGFLSLWLLNRGKRTF